VTRKHSGPWPIGQDNEGHSLIQRPLYITAVQNNPE
jgi:hypothetical protein